MHIFLHPILVRTILAIYGLMLLPQAGFGQEKSKKFNVAVMDFTARGGISSEEAATLSDVFQSKLAQYKDITLVDRNRIKAILQEQGFQQSEVCSQVECLVEAGKILKVDKMFAGTVGKVGKIYNVTIQAIDVTTAQILQTVSKQHTGDIEELVSDVIPAMADELAMELTGAEKAVSKSRGGSGWLWWVLGGAVVAGGGVAAYLLTQQNNGKGGSGSTPTQTGALTKFPGFPQ